MMGNNTGRFRT